MTLLTLMPSSRITIAPTRTRVNLTDWYFCWRRHAHAVMFVYPSRIAELDTVLNYDRMVRKLVGSDRGVLFNETAKFETFKHEIYTLAINNVADDAERLIGNGNHSRNGGGRRRG
ncbi:hypothetical protein WG66_009794 [Moniliophthora roreri]|nr:hypothetical protein WG66_009794 [Moniliophthora roreri]